MAQPAAAEDRDSVEGGPAGREQGPRGGWPSRWRTGTAWRVAQPAEDKDSVEGGPASSTSKQGV